MMGITIPKPLLCSMGVHNWEWWLDDDVCVRCVRCYRRGAPEKAPAIVNHAPAAVSHRRRSSAQWTRSA